MTTGEIVALAEKKLARPVEPVLDGDTGELIGLAVSDGEIRHGCFSDEMHVNAAALNDTIDRLERWLGARRAGLC